MILKIPFIEALASLSRLFKRPRDLLHGYLNVTKLESKQLFFYLNFILSFQMRFHLMRKKFKG